jgi:VanZ family protein
MSSARPPFGFSRRLRAWLWVGLWALFVWGLGGEDLSYDHTSRFLGPLIRWLLPEIPEATSELLQFSIRKTAQLAEYAVLGCLTLRAFSIEWPTALPRSAVAAVIFSAAFAAADETRQSLSAARMGSGWDVMLDSLGAAAGIALLLWARTRLPGLDRWIGLYKLPAAVSAEGTHGETAE